MENMQNPQEESPLYPQTPPVQEDPFPAEAVSCEEPDTTLFTEPQPEAEPMAEDTACSPELEPDSAKLNPVQEFSEEAEPVPEDVSEEISLEEEISREVSEMLEQPDEFDLYQQEQEQALKDAYQGEESFDEIFNAPAPEEPAPVFDRPARKGRPRRKKGEFLFGLPQLAVTAVWFAVILVVGVTLGRMLWVCAADVLAFGREPREVTVTVYESDTIEDITDKLHKAGLIRYPGLFKLYADFAVDEGEIRAGIWDLNTVYDYHALVNMMSPSSSREEIEVLIPEGYTCRQIFSLLEENKVCTAVDIANYAATGELDEYWFLEDVTRGEKNCLEGFLFPDTYKFYKNDSPRAVLQKMLDNFDYRFTEDMRSAITALNEELGSDYEIRDIVIVASLIEKETSGNWESPKIASVIYNRLHDWDGNPPYLNIDAAIVYALDGKTDLTAEDLKVDSPYNTYLYTGLTPGAISNPGLASLQAALYPANTNYYYYVLNPVMGEHMFSTTYDEHRANIASME